MIYRCPMQLEEVEIFRGDGWRGLKRKKQLRAWDCQIKDVTHTMQSEDQSFPRSI